MGLSVLTENASTTRFNVMEKMIVRMEVMRRDAQNQLLQLMM